jgi:branched-chain amino acid transport system substrate-binding protein
MTHTSVRHRRGVTAVLAAMLCATLCAAMAACSSSVSSGSTAGATGRAQSFTSPPIVVTSMTGVNTPLGSFPQIFAGAMAAANAINAAGGINHHELIVHTCNTNSTPSGEVACAQQAISNGSIATVGDFVYTNEVAVEQMLNKAGIADVAGFTVAPLPNQFPLLNILANKAACFDPAFTKLADATKAVGVVLGLAASQTLNSLNQQMAKGLNNPIPIAPSVAVPGTTTDFTPIVQKIDNTGANLVIANMSIPTSTSLVSTATSLGHRWTYCGDFGTLSAKTLTGLGSAATGMYLVDYFPPPTAAAQYPLLQRFLSEMKAEQNSGNAAASVDSSNYISGMLNAWLGVQIVQQAAEKINGPVTRQSFMTAVSTLTPNLGNIVSVDFAKPAGTGNFGRIFNPYIVLWHWDPSKQNWFLVPGIHTNSLQAVGAEAG